MIIVAIDKDLLIDLAEASAEDDLRLFFSIS
jgi:hypothetical protein